MVQSRPARTPPPEGRRARAGAGFLLDAARLARRQTRPDQLPGLGPAGRRRCHALRLSTPSP
jgi:hypothetical protein